MEPFSTKNEFLGVLAVEAQYTAQTMPGHKDNPLIEALPAPMSDDYILRLLTVTPYFEIQDRLLPIEERYKRLLDMRSFFIPSTRHVKYAYILDGLLRESLIGRAPRTRQHVEMLQSFYKASKSGEDVIPELGERWDALSATFIGVSGVGKTTTTARILMRYPPAIWHEGLRFYQIPCVVLQCPRDGSTVKGLALQFFSRFDEVLKTSTCNRYESSRMNEDSLSTAMASLAHLHSLGLLIIEDVQNIAGAGKNEKKRLPKFFRMLVNKLHHALLLIGTNKAAELVNQDFSEARRATGFGIEFWDRYLPPWLKPEQRAVLSFRVVREGEYVEDEWTPFIQALWRFQWVRQPIDVPDESMQRLLFELTQGVPDIVVKLFVATQFAAMVNGQERLSPELFRQVFFNEFAAVRPMIEALASGNPDRLRKFDDLTPLNFNAMLSNMELKRQNQTWTKEQGREKRAATVNQVAAAVAMSGAVSPVVARAVAEAAIGENETDAFRAMKSVISAVEPARKLRKELKPQDLEQKLATLSPEDFRTTFLRAKRDKKPVAEAFFEMHREALTDLLGYPDVGLSCNPLQG